MPALFAITLFISATLLFMVQPMVGKMVLPMLGGGAGVWNTCMLFFQMLLLLGYLYAHKLSSIQSMATQVRIHLGVLLLSAGVMLVSVLMTESKTPVPILKSLAPQGSPFPFLNVLAILGMAIGVPFFAVSTSAPLLQRWFTATGHHSSKDPYFLYAASNAGSLISLLGYPLVTEPSLRLLQQSWLWGAGFLLLIGVTWQCGRAAIYPLAPVPSAEPTPEPTSSLSPDISWQRKLRWIGYAFVPSSLMLGVTTHMTTDIASVPLLWVIPLALYLTTFIIAFSTKPSWFRTMMGNLSPVATLILVFVIVSGLTGLSTFAMLGIHLGVYFMTALLMHSELALDRPDPKHLTEYFLLMSIGGMLGGLFNSIVAVLILPYTYEYPIAIVIGCMLIPSFSALTRVEEVRTDPEDPSKKGFAMLLDLLIPLIMLLILAGIYYLATLSSFKGGCETVAVALNKLMVSLNLRFAFDTNMVQRVVAFAPPCMACFLFIDRPIRFGLCVAAVLFMHYFDVSKNESVKMTHRSFYGILKVDESPENEELLYMPAFTYDLKDDKGNLVLDEDSKPKKRIADTAYGYAARVRSLSHGTTLHGRQFVEPFTFVVGIDPNTKDFIRINSSVPPLLSDDARLLGCFSGWESLALLGGKAAWDITQDPLTYYHRSGPIGDIFRDSFRRTEEKFHRLPNVAMVGLGTGSVSCYAAPGMTLTYYEIDQSVIDMVEAPRYLMNKKQVQQKKEEPEYGPFSFVDDARKRGATIEFVTGDARLKLEEQKDRKYDLLLIDAFSSDSIPIHLLTVESMKLYEQRLAENGLLAMHISNRYIELEPVVAAIAKQVGMAARVWSDSSENQPGKTASSWVILARKESELGQTFLNPQPQAHTKIGRERLTWTELDSMGEVPAWTDDHADVLRVIRFKEIQRTRRLLGLPTLPDIQ